MTWYLTVLKKYAVFSGRARRLEYWSFTLFNCIINFTFYFISYSALPLLSVFYILYTLGLLIPSIAVTVRRLHDIGKSGYWYFINFIPLIGAIWMLILLTTEGTPEDNQYGADPKASEEYYGHP